MQNKLKQKLQTETKLMYCTLTDVSHHKSLRVEIIFGRHLGAWGTFSVKGILKCHRKKFSLIVAPPASLGRIRTSHN